jgi:Xaa-Pro aminopeptidase
LLTRDVEAKPAIITSHFIYYYTFSDGGPRKDIPAYLYDVADDDGHAFPPETVLPLFADQACSQLTDIEARRRRQTDAALAQDHYFVHAGGALEAALRDHGLDTKSIAIDHPTIREVCARRNWACRLSDADNLMRWIRIVKSPLEIELMKRGAQANVDAVNAVVASVREGIGYREMRQIFAVEAAKRGNQSVFMTIDRVSSTTAVGDKVENGQSLFIDGVSHFQNYHGDYARTVFVGEPNREGLKIANAAKEAWEAIRADLKPGLRYSEIIEKGLSTIKKAGLENTIGFGPHSVGLMHTDEPGAENNGFYGKENLVLEENMVLSVDCPALVTGVGGSIHLEDLVHITSDGAETIHPIHDHVIII